MAERLVNAGITAQGLKLVEGEQKRQAWEPVVIETALEMVAGYDGEGDLREYLNIKVEEDESLLGEGVYQAAGLAKGLIETMEAGKERNQELGGVIKMGRRLKDVAAMRMMGRGEIDKELGWQIVALTNPEGDDEGVIWALKDSEKLRGALVFGAKGAVLVVAGLELAEGINHQLPIGVGLAGALAAGLLIARQETKRLKEGDKGIASLEAVWLRLLGMGVWPATLSVKGGWFLLTLGGVLKGGKIWADLPNCVLLGQILVYAAEGMVNKFGGGVLERMRGNNR